MNIQDIQRELNLNYNEAALFKERAEKLGLFNVMPSFSDLAAKRKRLGLTLRDVAIETDIPFPTICRIEQGKECELSSYRKLVEFYSNKA